MDARPDDLYGESLRADIPRLEIKTLSIEKILSPSCFSRMPLTLSAPQSEKPDRGDALNHVIQIQTDPQVRLIVEANEAIILMINSFVDFFIQYYCIGYTRELNPLILRLKEIIFNSTTNESESFTASGYNELLHTILSKLLSVQMHQWVVESSDSEVYFFPKNVGRQLLNDGPDVVPVAYTDSGADAVDEHAVLIESRFIASKTRLKNLTQVFLPNATQELHRKQLQKEVDAINLYLDDKLFIISTTSKFQKFEIFYLLFLSYHVLSMSGIFFDIQIQDLDEILHQEIARGKPNSFILEFLPYDESKDVESRTVINIIKSQLLTFFFNKNDIYFMPALRELQLKARTTMPALERLLRGAADTGGSKRVNNKSRKNKYKRKYNHKYKKSRKNKRHRRKRTQSNQNKMF
jgi:hypothetical protein